MKVQIKSKSLRPFAGISFFEKCFNTSGLQQLYDNEIGSRVIAIDYSYSDIIINYWALFFSGGNYAEHIQANLGKHLKRIPCKAVQSAYKVLQRLKEYATMNTKYNYLITYPVYRYWPSVEAAKLLTSTPLQD